MALASSALAQGTLAEQALDESGAVATDPAVVSPAPAIADTAPPPIIDSVVMPAPATPAPVIPPVPKPQVMVAPKKKSDSANSTSGRRIAVLAGVTDWHWEEADNSGDILLVEGGMIPMARFEYSILKGNNEFGGALEMSFGAIDYDGGIQNGETGEITEFKTKTHYAVYTFEGFAFFSDPAGKLPLSFGGRLGYHQWVRTIGSDTYQEPDEESGYVETWTHWSVQPVLIFKQSFGPNSHFRLEGGIRVPMSTKEKISDLPGGGGLTLTLKPKTETAYRVQGEIKISHLLLEVEYLALDFGKSPLDSKYGVAYQPDSYLDRLDARVGWEF